MSIIKRLLNRLFYCNQQAVIRAMRAVFGGWQSTNLIMIEVSKDKNK